MNLTLIMKLLHVLAAFWFISGVVGRDLTFWRAGKARDPQSIHSLLQVSDLFERWGVIPVGMLLILFGLVTAWLQRWPILGFLQGAQINWVLVSLILSLGVTLFVFPLRLVARRKQRAQAAEDALAKGEMTPELAAALHDKVVIRFRLAEAVLLVIIIVLMVMKPF